MFLHFRDRRGAALLRYGESRVKTTILMCEQKQALSGMVFVPAQKLSFIVWT